MPSVNQAAARRHSTPKDPNRIPHSRKGSLIAIAAAAMAVLAGLVISLAPAWAAHRSNCENGVAVGRTCHYVSIVSEGPDYDADMVMQTLDGYPYPGVSPWHEGNPSLTRWYWDYDQNATTLDFKLHLTIRVRGTNWGLDTTLPGDRNTCFQISGTTHQVHELPCPQDGGIG